MRKRMIMRIATAMSLILVLLVGQPDAGLAHPQVTDAPSAFLTSRPAAVVDGYTNVDMYQNWITGGCLTDDPQAGIYVGFCMGNDPNTRKWGFTLDYTDEAGHNIGTLQNQRTGSCLDDSPAKGLRAYLCHLPDDPARVHQRFRLTYVAPYGYVLQNMATGSCVDYSDPNQGGFGLRGYYCIPNDYFQVWTPGLF
jgi:hypothetical protein